MEDFERVEQEKTTDLLKRLKFRKKALRRFAIIFFVVLILLTFFSNTIMNYSLPEVSTVTVFRGTVSKKIRCEGAVEVGSELEVTVSGSRTVKEIMVEDGDTVHEGDVIMTFEETENTELKEAEDTLETLESNFEKQKLRSSNDYTDDEVSIQNAKDDLTDAQNALTQAKADAAELVTVTAERDELQTSYDAKYAEVEGLQAKVDAYQSMESYSGDVDVDALVAQLATAKTELAELETTLNAKKDRVTELEAKTTVADAEDNVTTKQQSLDSLERALTSKKAEDSLTAQSNAIDDAASQKEIDDQKAKIEKLKAADDCKEIKANGSGIISGITVRKGDKVSSESPVATIQLTDAGYQVSCTVSKADSRVLKVGDEADIENVWGDDVSSTIKSIKANPTNPNQESNIKFEVKGNVQVGETLQFAVGEKSAKYDTVVPNGAVKEDSDGHYVYAVKIKATPLGNRYIVRKVSVEVLASDTINSAIQGEITEYDNVITNASKPLDNGQQVRLTDN